MTVVSGKLTRPMGFLALHALRSVSAKNLSAASVARLIPCFSRGFAVDIKNIGGTVDRSGMLDNPIIYMPKGKDNDKSKDQDADSYYASLPMWMWPLYSSGKLPRWLSPKQKDVDDEA